MKLYIIDKLIKHKNIINYTRDIVRMSHVTRWLTIGVIFMTKLYRNIYDKQCYTDIFMTNGAVPKYLWQTALYRNMYDKRCCTEIFMTNGSVPKYLWQTAPYRNIYDKRCCTEIFMTNGAVPKYLWQKALYRNIYGKQCCTEIFMTNSAAPKYLWQTVLYRNIYDKQCCTEKNKHSLCSKIKSISVQTQTDSIDCTEMHVSTYLRSSSGVGVLLMCGCFIVWVFC